MLRNYMKFWGKADAEAGKWHPLVFHTLDVAGVAVAYCSANPVFVQHWEEKLKKKVDFYSKIIKITIISPRSLRWRAQGCLSGWPLLFVLPFCIIPLIIYSSCNKILIFELFLDYFYLNPVYLSLPSVEWKVLW